MISRSPPADILPVTGVQNLHKVTRTGRSNAWQNTVADVSYVIRILTQLEAFGKGHLLNITSPENIVNLCAVWRQLSPRRQTYLCPSSEFDAVEICWSISPDADLPAGTVVVSGGDRINLP